MAYSKNQNLYYRWSKEFCEGWRKNAWPGIRLEKPTATRSRNSATKRHSSKRRGPRPCSRIEKAPTGPGATIHEIHNLGKTRDRRSGGTIVVAGTTHAESTGHSEVDLLRLYERIREGGDDALMDGQPGRKIMYGAARCILGQQIWRVNRIRH